MRPLNAATQACTVVMAPLHEAPLQTTVHSAVNFLLRLASESSAPLHEATVLGLSIVPKGGTESVYTSSIACVRQVGVDLTRANPHLGAQMTLSWLGHIAVAQHIVGVGVEAERDLTNPPMTTHVFMLAQPVRIEGSRKWALQFSILPFDGKDARCDSDALTTDRTDELRDRYMIFFYQRLRVTHVAGMPAFLCKPEMDPCVNVPGVPNKPNLPWERVATALNISPAT